MMPGKFHSTISTLLSERLKPIIAESKDLNLVSCLEIYTTIFDTLVESIEASNAPISNEGMNYLAQSFYDGILVNGTQELDPDIFTQRAGLQNIDTKELALLAVMLQGTDFSLPIIQEIKKRS